MLIAVPVVLMLLVTGTGYWLLRTSSGAAWLWEQLENTTAGAVHASGIEGDLASGFVVRDVIYQSDSVDLTVGNLVIHAGIGWWPVTVEIKTLTLDDVGITTRQAGDQAPVVSGDTDIGNVLSSLDLPVALRIEQAVINTVTLRQGENLPQDLADSIQISAALEQQLLVGQINVIAGGLSASLGGHLQLKAPFDLSANIEGDFETDAERSGLDLKLPFKATAQGRLDDWAFELDTNIQTGQFHSSMLVASGTGTSQAIDIQKVSVNGKGVDLDIQGALDWSSAPAADFNAVIRQLDLSPWLGDWPVGRSIEGNFELNWSQNGLAVPVCKLTVNGTDMTLDLVADIDIAANKIDARLDWHNLEWPLADGNAVFSSPSGRLNLSGNVDQWTTAGQIEMSIGEYPQGNFDVQADGGATHAHLLVAEGEVLGGSISGEANADWADNLNWKAMVNANGVNLATVFQQWPGQLDAKLEIEVNGLEDATRIKIIGLEGRIRDVPVYAHGAIRFSDNKLSFDQLEARTDQAVMSLDGDAATPKGISMTYSGELPALLLSGAHGSIEAQGRYSSHADGQLLELNLEALGLVWNEYQVKELSIHSHGPGPVPELQLDAADVSLADILLDEVSLSLKSIGKKHSLGMNIAGENVAFSSAAFVMPEHEERPFSGEWLVNFKDMTLAINQTFIFSLLEPAKLNWSADVTTLSALCLTETAGAKFCLSGELRSDGGNSLIADVTTVPVNYLQDLFELDIRFEQLLEGRLEWHQATGQAPTGGADIRITAGKIIDLEDNHLLLETNEGRFAFKLQNGNLESGTFDLEFPGSGYFDVDFDVLDIVDDGARILKGRAFVKMEDIKVLGQLALPGVDEISGRFESGIQLGGTLTDPVFEGGFKFSDGLVEYAPIGLMLEDIEFEGQLEKLDRGSFKGGFRAGEGLGSIYGRLLFDDIENTLLEVELSGEQLLLLNTDELKLRTETNIKLALSPERLDINGHISIPSARFSPSNLLVGGVSDSEDLVIEPIAGEMEMAAEQSAPTNRVYGALEVSFGDDVLIEVPGVETTLGGSVIFSWDGDPMPLAQGSYELNGTVSFYGPTLQINNGHISFPGVAADNPVLNIRAQRDIFGNTQIRSAGVQLIGTLKRPRLEAYTVPVTNEDRAWTILVTGTDFDQGQGVNGFDVGTYIAPRLFVSYGISLFDDDNVISARYDLKKSFGIKVSSGQRETGLDISYTIDK